MMAPFPLPFIFIQQQTKQTSKQYSEPIKAPSVFSISFFLPSLLTSHPPFVHTHTSHKNDIHSIPPNNIHAPKNPPNSRQYQQRPLPVHIFPGLAGPPLPDHRPRHHCPHPPGDLRLTSTASPQPDPRLLPLWLRRLQARYEPDPQGGQERHPGSAPARVAPAPDA